MSLNPVRTWPWSCDRTGMCVGVGVHAQVLRTLQPLRPAECLTELVDRIAFSLSAQMKADEMLTLMRPLIQEKIVQVAHGAIFSAFNVLLSSGKRTETLDVRTMYISYSSRME